MNKDVDKHSTKLERDILDKYDEFIFDDSEEKIEGKNTKNFQVDVEKQRESEVISNNIF